MKTVTSIPWLLSLSTWSGKWIGYRRIEKSAPSPWYLLNRGSSFDCLHWLPLFVPPSASLLKGDAPHAWQLRNTNSNMEIEIKFPNIFMHSMYMFVIGGNLVDLLIISQKQRELPKRSKVKKLRLPSSTI